MAIGLENFQPETFAQANPFLTGFAASQDIANQMIQNQLQANQARQVGIQNQYLGPTLQQKLIGLGQTNQIQAPFAQNAPAYAQAELSQLQALPGLTGAETVAQLASARAQQAQAGFTGQQQATLAGMTPEQIAHAAATIYTQPGISALNQWGQYAKNLNLPNFLGSLGGIGGGLSNYFNSPMNGSGGSPTSGSPGENTGSTAASNSGGPTPPASVTNLAQFRAWFNTLSDSDKIEYDRSHGGGK